MRTGPADLNRTPIVGAWEPHIDSPPHGSSDPGGRISVTVIKETGALADLVITLYRDRGGQSPGASLHFPLRAFADSTMARNRSEAFI